MRSELADILYGDTRRREYLFEDSIRTIVEESGHIAVAFEHPQPTGSTS